MGSDLKYSRLKRKTKKYAVLIFQYILLAGLAYVIIYPLIYKIFSVFMSRSDIYNPTVFLIPQEPTLDNLIKIVTFDGYIKSYLNTIGLSVLCALLQTISCALVAYGFARYNFRFKNFIFALVIFTMIIPPQVLSIPLYFKFLDFDIGMMGGGILHFIFGKGIPMLDTLFPNTILSVTALAFKNALYIFMLRQFFMGVPIELTEAATVDGAGQLTIFARVILPLAGPMLTTILIFAVSWQWTDSFYSGIFFTDYPVMSTIVNKISVNMGYASFDIGGTKPAAIAMNAAAFLILVPLIIMYLFAQKRFIQGIENSGIVG